MRSAVDNPSNNQYSKSHKAVLILDLDQIVSIPIDEPAVQIALDYLEDADFLAMSREDYAALSQQFDWDEINPITTLLCMTYYMTNCSPHLLKELSSVAYHHIYKHWRDGELNHRSILRHLERFLVDWQEVSAAEFLSGSGEEHHHMNEAKKLEVAEKLLKDSDMEHLAVITVDGDKRFLFRGDLEDYYSRPW